MKQYSYESVKNARSYGFWLATILWVTVAAMLFVIMATANATVETGPTRYRKVDGPDTMPYRIVLKKNCRNAEDTLGRLILVDYTPERVVYRCRRPWQY